MTNINPQPVEPQPFLGALEALPNPPQAGEMEGLADDQKPSYQNRRSVLCTCDACGNTFQRKWALVYGKKSVFCNAVCQFSKHPMERFFGYVVIADNGCWVWNGSRNHKGYGGFRLNGILRNTHRLSYQWFIQEDIPQGLQVLHRCDNPPCCNPNHLWLGTPKDNSQDMVQKGRNRPSFMKGENHGNSVLKSEQVVKMRELAKSNLHTGKAIAKMFGISSTTVYDILNGKSWSHLK